MLERLDAFAMRGRLKMKRLIASIAIPIVVLISFPCIASEPKGMVSEEDLSCFFESIERKGTNIVFTTHGGGGRFVYRINGSKGKVSGYGETIVLPENSELEIVERSRYMKLSPLSGKDEHKGFRVFLEKDFRSIRGGNLTTNYAYMVYLDAKPDSSGGEKGNSAPEGNRAMVKSAGAPEKGADRKCLKSLTLLPCEEKEQ